MRTIRFLGLVIVLTVPLVACRPSAGRKDHPRVTAGDLAGLRYQPQASGGAAAPRFDWSFTEDRFQLEAGADPIPPALLAALLGPGAAAKRVGGHWAIEGDELVLSELTADGRVVGGTARLSVWNTGVIRVSLPSDANAQFVFSR
jgi:hypothetical protein